MPSYSFKKLQDYTDAELIEAVSDSRNYCADFKMDFYRILNGVDAYQEQRRRRLLREAQAMEKLGKKSTASEAPSDEKE